jgi:hypothetical protein
MVSPVRIRVPPLEKVLQNTEKSKAPVLRPELFYCNWAVAEGFIHHSCWRVAQAG